MIAAAATAVGINMTFLMPYTILHRGWDKTFRGLARFDLSTGMAIPYILVTSCVVIAAAFSFHAKAEPDFLSNVPAKFEKSPTFGGAKATLALRVRPDLRALNSKELGDALKKLQKDEPQKWQAMVADMAALPASEKKIASSLVKRKSHALAVVLAELIGKKNANLVFGLGVFGMGFSTIIILMLINGFVFCEAANKPHRGGLFIVGCLVAGVVGIERRLNRRMIVRDAAHHGPGHHGERKDENGGGEETEKSSDSQAHRTQPLHFSHLTRFARPSQSCAGPIVKIRGREIGGYLQLFSIFSVGRSQLAEVRT